MSNFTKNRPKTGWIRLETSQNPACSLAQPTSGQPLTSTATPFFPMISLFVGLIVIATVSLTSPLASAQPPQKKQKDKEKEERVIPDPENITVKAKDGVNVKCTYFAPPVDEKADAGAGKEVAPFILIHDWEGNRQDLLPFAKYLQNRGFAVIVPDLRGHGDSTTVEGSNKTIDYKKFRKNDYLGVLEDIEACKRYLVKRNNEGKLNIGMLNVVAVGKSSVLGVLWTLSDWKWPNIGAIKQGKDVKSIILVSPRKKLKNLALAKAIKTPLFAGRQGTNLPTLVIWSANDPVGSKEGDSIYSIMEKGRPDLDDIKDKEERAKKQTLYKAEIPRSDLDGTELIRDNKINGLWKYLADFVDYQVLSKKDDYRWQSRERK